MRKLATLVMLLASIQSVAQLIGTKSVLSNLDSDSAGQAEAFKETALSTGKVISLSVYIDSRNTASKVFAGIYSDVSGHPRTLLCSGSFTPAAGWNTISITPACSLTKGTVYNVTLLGTGGTIQYRDTGSGGHSETSRQSSLTSLPSTWSSGQNWSSSPVSVYASGTAVVAISISPISATVNQGAQKQFTATVTGTTSTGVNWSITQGTASINSSGLLTAPNVQETDTVQAQSQADTTKTATATVSIPAVQVTISPTSLNISPGGTQQFTATVTGTVDQSVQWAEQGNGSVSNVGFYTAPSASETDIVSVQSLADSTKSAAASITVAQIHHAKLGWQDSDTNVSFNLYRSSTTGGPYSKIVSNIMTLDYTDATVLAGQAYYYVVTAVNQSATESDFSNEAKAVIP